MQLRTGLPKHLARQEVKRTTPPRAVGREGEWLNWGGRGEIPSVGVISRY